MDCYPLSVDVGGVLPGVEKAPGWIHTSLDRSRRLIDNKKDKDKGIPTIIRRERTEKNNRNTSAYAIPWPTSVAHHPRPAARSLYCSRSRSRRLDDPLKRAEPARKGYQMRPRNNESKKKMNEGQYQRTEFDRCSSTDKMSGGIQTALPKFFGRNRHARGGREKTGTEREQDSLKVVVERKQNEEKIVTLSRQRS
jgi:hypothetical protein